MQSRALSAHELDEVTSYPVTSYRESTVLNKVTTGLATLSSNNDEQLNIYDTHALTRIHDRNSSLLDSTE